MNGIIEFIKTWGSLIIATVSLIFAVISFFKSSKAQKLQNKINEISLTLKKYELDKLFINKEACVQARFIQFSKNGYKIKIWNSGNSNAYNINLELDDSNIIIRDKDVLPYEILESSKSFELVVFIYPGARNKVKITTYWDNEQKEHKLKEQIETW